MPFNRLLFLVVGGWLVASLLIPVLRRRLGFCTGEGGASKTNRPTGRPRASWVRIYWTRPDIDVVFACLRAQVGAFEVLAEAAVASALPSYGIAASTHGQVT